MDEISLYGLAVDEKMIKYRLRTIKTSGKCNLLNQEECSAILK